MGLFLEYLTMALRPRAIIVCTAVQVSNAGKTTIGAGAGLTVSSGGLTVPTSAMFVSGGSMAVNGDVNVNSGSGTVSLASTVTATDAMSVISTAASFANNLIVGRLQSGATSGNAMLLQASGTSVFQVRYLRLQLAVKASCFVGLLPFFACRSHVLFEIVAKITHNCILCHVFHTNHDLYFILMC